jgi:hypothetical protein
MNLRKMKFWNSTNNVNGSTAVGSAPQPLHNQTLDALSNVIQMPARSPLDEPAGLAPAPAVPVDELTAGPTPSSMAQPTAGQPKGLLEAPELQAFFAENFFGLGRHNGSFYRTQEAMEQGKQGLISRFQNTLSFLVEQRQAKVDKFVDMQLQTDGICNTVTAQLGLARSRNERDMNLLREQMALADLGKGWVLEALNRYQIGFGKGLREAIDFELLGN